MDLPNPLDEFELEELEEHRRKSVEEVISAETSQNSKRREDFIEKFTLDSITEKEKVKETRYLSTYRCETNFGMTVYFGSLNSEDRPKLAESKIKRRRFGQILAQDLGLNTVWYKSSVEEEWFASPEFKGEYDTEKFTENPENLEKLINVLSKHYAMMSWDISDDILIDDSGEFVSLDISPMSTRPVYSAYKLLGSASGILTREGFPAELVDIIAKRGHDISLYVCYNHQKVLSLEKYPERKLERYLANLPFKTEKMPIKLGNHREQPVDNLNMNRQKTEFVSRNDHWRHVEEFLASKSVFNSDEDENK